MGVRERESEREREKEGKAHVAGEGVEEGAVLVVRRVLGELVLPDDAPRALVSLPSASARLRSCGQDRTLTAKSTILNQPPAVPQP